MKKAMMLLTIVFIVSFLISAKAQNPNPSPEIDEAISSIMESQNLPGVSTVIIKEGNIVWLKSYGYANIDSQTPYTDSTSQMIASISKVFTGIAMMQLYETGSINLNEDISNYLPFEIKNPNYPEVPITCAMLLTNTASILDAEVMDSYYNWEGDPTITLADCIQRYFSPTGADYSATDNFMDEEPGTVYEYSNMGTALEGYIVEVVSGIPFAQYCQENIFDLLSMDKTHWYLSEYESLDMLANPHDSEGGQLLPISHYGFADYPDGMLHSNVKDLANFMITILQGGQYQGETLLSAETIESMFTLQIPEVDSLQGYQFYQTEFNVNSGSIMLWGHSGGETGISTEMYFDHDNDMGIAVLTNSGNKATEIYEKLYDYGLNLSVVGIDTPPDQVISEPYYLYPNPASRFITFKTNNLNIADIKITISDITGRQLQSWQNNNQFTTTIDISKYPNGTYIYSIEQNKIIIQTGKFIIAQ